MSFARTMRREIAVLRQAVEEQDSGADAPINI
jgi:hypothetical protein